MALQWEFSGSATQTHFTVAQAVADAMEALGVDYVSSAVVDRACEILGDGWDAKSVWAYIENCSFEVIA